MAHVIGIDASLSCTAVVAIDENGSHTSAVFGEKPAGKTISARIARYNRLVERVVNKVESCNPSVICIEGYFVGLKGYSAIALAEFGSLLPSHLVSACCDAEIHEVAPTMLKKYVTGSGAGKKLKVITNVQHKWGVMFGSDDEFDAYGLARMAMCIAGTDEPTNQHQREVLEKLTGRSYERSLKETVAMKGTPNGKEESRNAVKAPF